MLYYSDFFVPLNHCTSFEICLYHSLSVVHVSVFCAWRLNSETFMCKTDTFIINSLSNDNGIVVYYFIVNESLLPVIVVNIECEGCNYLCNGYRCLC